MMHERTQKTIMNANLFSRLFDNLDNPARLAIEMLDGGMDAQLGKRC